MTAEQGWLRPFHWDLAHLATYRGERSKPLLEEAVDLAVRMTGASYGAYFKTVGSERLDAFALSGVPRDVFPRPAEADLPPVRITDVFAPTVSGEGTTVLIDDLFTDPRYGQVGGMPPGHPPVRSYLAVPVKSIQGVMLGAILLAHVQPGRFSDASRHQAEAVATYAAVAIENARSYEAEQLAMARLGELAQVLQRSLLPRTLPPLDRVEVAVRYLPAEAGQEIGGDWYDVVVSEHQVTFVIGDVQGHSSTAAALMGQLRTAVRAYVSEGHAPGAALARTNTLLGDLGPDLFATCALVQLDQRTGAMRVATAGHPPPLVVREGAVREVEVDPGIPLGVELGSTYAETMVQLTGRAQVLLYTDGLVETVAGGITADLPRVMSIAGGPHRDIEALVHAVMSGVASDLSDDAALLGLSYAGPVGQAAELDVEGSPGAPGLCRRFLHRQMDLWGVGGDTADCAAVVLSELVTNAAIHAEGRVRLKLEVDDGRLRISVTDASTGLPRQRQAEEGALGGRGLAIVEAMSEDWGVVMRPTGKTVWSQLTISQPSSPVAGGPGDGGQGTCA
ncbi:SpoIIE family protein phosphatase [Quadrisphaera sp. INWT6]|uniref:ATP-binding SpoIIE family protein phosphatase n=1 Tax=Quadrisphaera sp. INWT6 TaxID=2596917 RepID=UPI00189258D4|nr:SpoIIE family protein phosphatase [Quadrisphaera sp. INWT6]MBF5081980.1 SpoIIE family protein phosphatase [Quadrisphaera sp. INWT6]